ncbi:MAG: HNH endonuclease [Clostridiaceae bacterium]|nr:HNH endonuclease [Clostridiaceae bacterium]
MTKRKQIDVDELKKVFRIRNGNLERIDLRRTDGKWKVVDNKDNDNGYCRVDFNGRRMYYHSIVWMLYNKKDIPANLEIDHINGNKIDNRIENLRIVTKRENQQNRKTHRAGRLVGASYRKGHNDWQSKIVIDKTSIKIGYYKTERQAHEAYKIACKHITNYVDNDSFRELIKKEMEK